MDFSSIVSEDKIKRAIKDGEFEGLPGMGKPLKKDDAAHVPEHLRMAYPRTLRLSRQLSSALSSKPLRPPSFRRFSSPGKPSGSIGSPTKKACFPNLPQRFIKKKCTEGSAGNKKALSRFISVL